jgi:hypothetical protein
VHRQVHESSVRQQALTVAVFHGRGRTDGDNDLIRGAQYNWKSWPGLCRAKI